MYDWLIRIWTRVERRELEQDQASEDEYYLRRAMARGEGDFALPQLQKLDRLCNRTRRLRTYGYQLLKKLTPEQKRELAQLLAERAVYPEWTIGLSDRDGSASLS